MRKSLLAHVGIARVRIARVGILAVLAGLAALPLRAESLADALVHGYENSGVLEQNRALLRVADEDVAQAVAELRPIISWAASITALGEPASLVQDEVSTSLSLSAEMLLWDGGRTALGVDAQREVVLATRQSLINAEQDILLRIVEAYMEVRRVGAFVGLRDNNVRLITQELRAAQDRFEVGEVTRTDVAQAEARLAAARSLLAAEQGSLARAQAEFVAAVGRRAGSLDPVAPAPIRYSLAEAQAFAVRNHPAIAQAQYSVSSAEIGVQIASLSAMPSVSLNGSLSTSFDNLDTVQESIGIRAGGPIYQGGLLASVERQAMARRDAARAQLLTTVQAVELGVAQAYSFLEVARASAQASERQVAAASIAFDGIREEATLGARTTLDVLNAEQELLDARANLISAQVDETVASYTLLSAMGLLTAQHLNLNVTTYDPNAYYDLVDDAPIAASAQGQALDRVLQAIGGE